MDCLFCKIVAGEIPSTKVYEDEWVYAFEDIDPQAPFHAVIVPKEHIASADGINAENSVYVARIFEAIPQIAAAEGLANGYRVITNCGEDGFLGLSCYSSDARDLNDAANEGNAKAKLTLKKLTYDITKFIGAYAAAMNGVDLIVFTGGIGENNPRLRRRICENLAYLGVKFDYDANVARGEDVMITLPDSKVKVAVITTNEELMIARDTMHIVLNEEE